ncbi:MAG TPA: transglycosylase SLT domain-containing protein [Saprospiraceae bacterium]|nr:hypothetical protein [Saprospirales bacterium]HRQ31350.1 transglycosylase SLT domain-containing protein [Saprospiraceae bacterium]
MIVSKLKIFSALLSISFLLFFIFPATADSGKSAYSKITDSDLKAKITNMSGFVDYRYNDMVKNAVESYINDQRRNSEELLGRTAIYFPIFEQKIRERNLPEEIKYISVIESSLQINSVSRKGAAGLWQFMRQTATAFGLSINKNLDERYTVNESTDAALDYLSYLYGEFGDWTLAIAAYNCGPGTINRAISKTGKRDYWAIHGSLPAETRKYIPKFIAAKYLYKYHYDHQLLPTKPDIYFFENQEALVFQHMSFQEISRVTDTNMDIIQNLNRSYLKNFIPTNTKGFKLVLPRQAMYKLLESKDHSTIQLLEPNSIDYNYYIRMNFHPAVVALLMHDFQETKEFTSVPTKQFDIPTDRGNKVDFASLSEHAGNSIKPKQYARRENFVYYRLKAGETLKDVARRYPNTSLESIIKLNNFSSKNQPTPGALIKICVNH